MGSVGCYSSILPIRCHVDRCESLEDVVVRMRDSLLAAFQHPDVPWPELLKEIAPPRAAAGSNPLFTTCFSFLGESYDNPSIPMSEAAFDYWFALGRSSSGDLQGMLTYDASVVSTPRARNLLACIEGLVQLIRQDGLAPGVQEIAVHEAAAPEP